MIQFLKKKKTKTKQLNKIVKTYFHEWKTCLNLLPNNTRNPEEGAFENTAEIGENAGDKYFLLFPHFFYRI